ncbi:SufD family Fe-S cluster assembly protein [Prosthecochloris sp. N3]|uniref:SufD family Fe-S cluster assembly protein n=1 Tax=Prosthecochloris ethylica TaxID=2743976 RepID=A0ABR9XU25_9CHLB|nr:MULTISPECIES: SufD family Fe-S cluster assembly protein [Prosthecochloris]MEC9486710.1 SufD family Fe-S cluster assembly protein [Prosthecochloris sp.]MBF0586992.1 SufD family Fe-S cluster assembly protein [Prosthecochloris ethylica]MBF0637475.1 SufD family Fe-S cluster assembly protein [Prosthecochloris ethylica]NUK48519.1 SufD family Fe-S cluster assembly protein [Prosthecochloris ethylica]RNA66112.1 SufD family Fe-S cluster assembly protein [Prosthecochloris sp. ZM_2]
MNVDLSKYEFSGHQSQEVDDLKRLDRHEQESMKMAGFDTGEKDRSASFVQIDHNHAFCKSYDPGVEILPLGLAMKIHEGLADYRWKLLKPDKDEFTRMASEQTHGGYVIRVKKGAKLTAPIQSCLMMHTNNVGQNVHNIVIIEEGAEAHILSGCTTSEADQAAAHIGISEFYVEKNAHLTFTMVHNWGQHVDVRPRSAGKVEAGGVFLSNYVSLKPVRNLQMYPSITMSGAGSVSRFNSVIVATEGTYMDVGNKVVLDAPDTRTEILSHAIASGGHIVARGHIRANHAPAKGHLECQGLLLNHGIIQAIPELDGRAEGTELSHEAAVGKIAKEELEYLMIRGLDEEQASSAIVRGFLNIDIMGLPEELKAEIDKAIAETEKSMF